MNSTPGVRDFRRVRIIYIHCIYLFIFTCLFSVNNNNNNKMINTLEFLVMDLIDFYLRTYGIITTII